MTPAIFAAAIVIAAAKIAGVIAGRFRQPAVFGEILVGLILGPTVLDLLGWPAFVVARRSGAGAPCCR